MKTVLASKGERLESNEQVLLEDVVHRRGEVSVLVHIYPTNVSWNIKFPSTIGLKVLDERDMPEYWHDSVESPEPNYPAFVYQVIRGGWFEQLWGISKMNDFYGTVYEFIVVGGDWCAVVLSTEPPVFSMTSHAR